jgi:DNA-binding NarL/FixJ family response regulator
VIETSAESLIRVAILADSRLFCEGLRRICATDASLTVVGEADLATVREVIRRSSPNVLVADGRIDGVLPLCRDLRRDKARPWVILLAAEADEDWAVRALEAGVRGILSKTATVEDFVKATHVVHEGQVWASKTVMARIVAALATLSRGREATEALLAQRLSPREQVIVRHATSGLSNQEIAERLNLSEATVKAELTIIFRKLGVRGRGQLTARYHPQQAKAPG